MSFSAQEISVEAGQPIELFDFRIGTDAYQWTTNPVAVTYSAITYQPMEIKREALAFSPDERAEALKITVPASAPLVRRFINSVPGQRTTLSIFRVHRNDGANEVIQVFKGVAQTVAFTLNGLTAEIATVPITAELANSIPRFAFSSVCNHVLYDQACTVAQSLFRHNDDVTSVSGDNISVQGLSAKGDGWATGGYIALASGEFRQILAHTGNTVRVLLPFPSSPLGQTVEVFAGCDHSKTTCDTKFSNGINFGGFIYVPLRNPFEGLDNA
ncbi:MAG: phage BR0599 family protein [Phycisphaerales bacterium]|nr:phage BR0599 family protein [Phycisphaerales bacterium]